MSDVPDILKRICADKRREVSALGTAERQKLLQEADNAPSPRGFSRALCDGDAIALIAEVKKASPSAGIIRPDFNPAAIAGIYERGGASCISVLTDEKYFSGSLQHLQAVRSAATLPILRKDFIIDEIQIAQARACGADCVLLIAAALDDHLLKDLIACARRWNLDTLAEVHTEQEMERAARCGADAIGINNRNLHTFEVDISTTERLAPSAPAGTPLVSESGIGKPDDIERLSCCGIDAVLVGQSLMQASEPETAVRELCNINKKSRYYDYRKMEKQEPQ